MYILISVTRKALEICKSFYPTRDEAYQAMLEDILGSTRYTSVDEIRRDAEKGKCWLTDEDAWAATFNEGTCQWKIVELPKENAPVSFYKRFLIENIESCQPYVITVGCSKANSSDMLENMLRLAIARYAKRAGIKKDITWSHFCAAIAGEDAFKDVCRKMGLTVEIDEGEPGLYDDETVFDKDRTVIVKDIKWNLVGDNPDDWFIPAETVIQAENEEKIADILEAEYGYPVVSYSVENAEDDK